MIIDEIGRNKQTRQRTSQRRSRVAQAIIIIRHASMLANVSDTGNQQLYSHRVPFIGPIVTSTFGAAPISIKLLHPNSTLRQSAMAYVTTLVLSRIWLLFALTPTIGLIAGLRGIVLDVLSYMQKDRFLRAAGFESMEGNDDYPEPAPIDIRGIDDDAWFEYATRKIESLNASPRPWFLALLTVGTHHPRQLGRLHRAWRRYPGCRAETPRVLTNRHSRHDSGLSGGYGPLGRWQKYFQNLPR